jgi:hypothetical protein
MKAAHKGVPVAQLPGTYSPGQAVSANGAWPPPDMSATTGATHPVPEASVGSRENGSRRHATTLLDLILGRSN